MILEIVPRIVFRGMLLCIAALVCANVLGYYGRTLTDAPNAMAVLLLFDFNTERSIPTFYSAVVLLLASALLAAIAGLHRRRNDGYLAWVGLSVIFAFLAVDESIALHERLTEPVRESLGAGGLLYFAWVIPYGLGLCAFLGVYAKFLVSLPKRARWWFVASGAVFVAGAIGLELVAGEHAESSGIDGARYTLLYSCEETLEMLGIAAFVYALLAYISDSFGRISITTAGLQTKAPPLRAQPKAAAPQRFRSSGLD